MVELEVVVAEAVDGFARVVAGVLASPASTGSNAVVIGLIVVAFVVRSRRFRASVAGWSSELAVAWAIRRRVPAARRAKGRILRREEKSAEIDLLIAAGDALYLIETKHRGCRRVMGGADDPEWIAEYSARRTYRFLNPLHQADRQRRFALRALAAAGLEVPVHRLVVIGGARWIPNLPSVFARPRDAAESLARHAARTVVRPAGGFPTPRAEAAFDALIEASGAGFFARIGHIARVSSWGAALRVLVAGAALVVGGSVLAVGIVLVLAPMVLSLPLVPPGSGSEGGDDSRRAPDRPSVPDVALRDRSTRPPSRLPPVDRVILELEASDRCAALVHAYVLDGRGGVHRFVATGVPGRLVPRMVGGGPPPIPVERWRSASGPRVEPLLVARVPTFRRHRIPFRDTRIWLPCSADGDEPLLFALEGRLEAGRSPAARYRSASNVIAVRDRDGYPDLGPSGKRIDWLAKPDRRVR